MVYVQVHERSHIADTAIACGPVKTTCRGALQEYARGVSHHGLDFAILGFVGNNWHILSVNRTHPITSDFPLCVTYTLIVAPMWQTSAKEML